MKQGLTRKTFIEVIHLPGKKEIRQLRRGIAGGLHEIRIRFRDQ